MFKPVIVVLLLVVVLAVLAYFAYMAFCNREENVSFGNWLKDPSHREAFIAEQEEREALTVSPDMGEPEIRSLVESLFAEKPQRFAVDKLKLLGDRATESLIEALGDPRTSRVKFGDGGILSDSSLSRIIEVFETTNPPAAVPALSKFIAHDDVYFRKPAGLVLGSIGTSLCVAPITKLLEDSDEYVRSHTMIGIKRAITGDRAEPEFRSAMFPLVESLVEQDALSYGRDAPKLLLALDRDRACNVLLPPRIWSKSNANLANAVQALNEIGCILPSEKLIPMIMEVEQSLDKYMEQRLYAELLIAYASNPDERTANVLREGLKSPHQKIRVAAVEGLCKLEGIKDPWEVVQDAIGEHGFAGLTVPRQHLYAVQLFDWEVCNGGLPQYFVNSYSDEWQTALEGLSAMNALRCQSILQEAVEVFGPNGPSLNRDKRHTQVARLTPKQDQILDGLSSRYYKCKDQEDFEVLLKLYVLKHKDSFSQK